MHRRLLPGLAAAATALLFCAVASASTSAFGPKTYNRTAGQSQSYLDTFVIAPSELCDGKAVFVLEVANGSNAVTSASINVNGVTVLDESDFPGDRTREVPLVLTTGNNTLGVTLKGGMPGSSLRISVRREIEEPVFGPKEWVLYGSTQDFDGAFSLTDPGSEFTLAVQNGDDAGLHAAKAFSLRINGVEVLTEKDLGRLVKRVRKRVALQGSNVVTVQVRGTVGAVLHVAIARQQDESACGPHVFFDTPADHATVPGSRIVTTGRATGRNDIGITVNGRAADIDLAHTGRPDDPFRWVASVRNMETGPVTLEAIVTDTHGGHATATRSVVFAPSSDEVSLEPSASVGVAPFLTSFDITMSPAFELASFAIDFDGDGHDDVSGLTAVPEPLTFEYRNAGIHRPRLRAADSNGVVHVSEPVIVVQTEAAIDRIVRERWDELRQRLAAQDVDGASELFSRPARGKYREVHTKLFARLPAIAAEMELLGALSITAQYAEYLVTRVEDGKTRGYYLSMTRDGDGIWRIADF